MPSNTRQRIIDAALGRFYRDGFRNVGIDQILADVGISKTAFYKHFESKDDVMLAVLEAKNRALLEDFAAVVREHGGEPVEQLRGVFDVLNRIHAADEYQGCIFISASVEFPLLHEPAHAAAARYKNELEDFVSELAAQAGAADPRALARELCLVMEGACISRQLTGDKHAILVARRVADLIINAHLPERRPGNGTPTKSSNGVRASRSKTARAS